MASNFEGADYRMADALERIADTLSRIEKILDAGLPGHLARQAGPTASRIARAENYRLQPKERHEWLTMEG